LIVSTTKIGGRNECVENAVAAAVVVLAIMKDGTGIHARDVSSRGKRRLNGYKVMPRNSGKN